MFFRHSVLVEIRKRKPVNIFDIRPLIIADPSGIRVESHSEN